jgi:hypothetical protein
VAKLTVTCRLARCDIVGEYVGIVVEVPTGSDVGKVVCDLFRCTRKCFCALCAFMRGYDLIEDGRVISSK